MYLYEKNVSFFCSHTSLGRILIRMNDKHRGYANKKKNM